MTPEKRRLGRLIVIFAAMTGPATAGASGTGRAKGPPGGLSPSDWAGLGTAHNLSRQALTKDADFLTGIVATGQQAYLKASNTQAFDHFATSVAVSGDTVVVGARSEDSSATGVNGDQANNGASLAGAAYVFVRIGGVWRQQAYLKASNTGAGDGFGSSVAISGDTVVVGAPFEDSSATGINGDQTNNAALGAGAAYVFVRSGGTWSQQAYLKPSNTEDDQFGNSVAISGDTIVVGAWLEDGGTSGINGNQADNSAMNAGAAYVFVRSGGAWSQQAYLKASNADAADTFGYSVAIAGDTLVVGAQGEDSNATGINGDQGNSGEFFDGGAAYVFVRNDGAWNEQAYLKASNTDQGDVFGWSVAVSDDTVVVSAVGEDSGATGVDSDQANNSAPIAGAAYVFVRSGGVWTQQAYLKASNTSTADNFGGFVGISGDSIVVSAFGEDSSTTGINGNQADNGATDAGAAYLFVRSGVAWSQQAYLKASNTDAFDLFGGPVAVSGDTVVVGAPDEASNAIGVDGDQSNDSANGAGAVYVFAPGERALLGDMNCNGVVNVADIAGFVLALTDPAGYEAAYPDCDHHNADLNMNGEVNVADIGLFVALLTGG